MDGIHDGPGKTNELLGLLELFLAVWCLKRSIWLSGQHILGAIYGEPSTWAASDHFNPELGKSGFDLIWISP